MSKIDTRAIEYFAERGFSVSQIEDFYKQKLFKVLTAEQAKAAKIAPIRTEKGYQWGDGILLQFTPDWAQFRLFQPLVPRGRDKEQRFTQQRGAAAVRLPDGAKVVTEGFADSLAIKTFGGVECGALMGVSHFRKLPKGSGLTTVFDSDGWTNPSVIRQLFNAAYHLKGKVTLFPYNPTKKLGATEFFSQFPNDDQKALAFKEILDSALDPVDFLVSWIRNFETYQNPRLTRDTLTETALKIVAHNPLTPCQQENIIGAISKITKYPKGTLKAQMIGYRKRKDVASEVDDNTLQLIEGTFAKLISDKLFSNPKCISVNGDLYRYCGTHYEELPKEIAMKEIAHFASTFYVKDKEGNSHTPFATIAHVESAYKWVVVDKTVPHKSINPSGLFNCVNGFLNVRTRELIPHSDEILSVVPPGTFYDKNADRTYAQKMLESLDPNERLVVLRALAVSLDLPYFRKIRGRSVTRALIFEGQGSNGKDTIREVMQILLGNVGICDVSLQDFSQYDQGRRFNLILLRNASINWASENTAFTTLDNLQSLKRVITGDTIVIEQKGKDAYAITPSCINIFNVNANPNLVGTSEAIRSRFAVVKFRKTFKENPQNPNELPVDYRFKEDPKFIIEQVAPGFLLELLDAYDAVVEEGIPYHLLDDSFKAMSKSHLDDFLAEHGLRATTDLTKYVTVTDVWDKLVEFYLEDGTVTVKADGSHIFNNQNGRYGDDTVKAKNQLANRLRKIFPNIQTGQIRDKNSRTSVIYGLEFSSPEIAPEPQPMPELDTDVLDAFEAMHATDPDACVTLVLETGKAPDYIARLYDMNPEYIRLFKGKIEDESAFSELDPDILAILFL